MEEEAAAYFARNTTSKTYTLNISFSDVKSSCSLDEWIRANVGTAILPLQVTCGESCDIIQPFFGEIFTYDEVKPEQTPLWHFHAGGPLSALDICPHRANQPLMGQLIALGTKNFGNVSHSTHMLGRREAYPNLLQLWHFTTHSVKKVTTTISYAIEIHSCGPIYDALWSSACLDCGAVIGLIAVVCGDGTCRVIQMPSTVTMQDHHNKGDRLSAIPVVDVSALSYWRIADRQAIITCVGWNKAGNQLELAAGLSDGAIGIWRINSMPPSGEDALAPLLKLRDVSINGTAPAICAVRCISYCPYNSSCIASGGQDGTLKVWDVNVDKWQPSFASRHRRDQFTALAWDACGQGCYIGNSKSCTVMRHRLWHSEAPVLTDVISHSKTQGAIWQIRCLPASSEYCLLFSVASDGSLVMAYCQDNVAMKKKSYKMRGMQLTRLVSVVQATSSEGESVIAVSALPPENWHAKFNATLDRTFNVELSLTALAASVISDGHSETPCLQLVACGASCGLVSLQIIRGDNELFSNLLAKNKTPKVALEKKKIPRPLKQPHELVRKSKIVKSYDSGEESARRICSDSSSSGSGDELVQLRARRKCKPPAKSLDDSGNILSSRKDGSMNMTGKKRGRPRKQPINEDNGDADISTFTISMDSDFIFEHNDANMHIISDLFGETFSEQDAGGIDDTSDSDFDVPSVQHTAPKKKRGRPRKYPPKALTPKRGRGRPRKADKDSTLYTQDSNAPPIAVDAIDAGCETVRDVTRNNTNIGNSDNNIMIEIVNIEPQVEKPGGEAIALETTPKKMEDRRRVKDSTAKRPRGRPRKQTSDVSADHALEDNRVKIKRASKSALDISQSNGEPTVKKKRGRPKKQPPALADLLNHAIQDISPKPHNADTPLYTVNIDSEEDKESARSDHAETPSAIEVSQNVLPLHATEEADIIVSPCEGVTDVWEV